MNVVESAVGGYLLGSLLSLLDQGSGWEFWVTAWASCFINIWRPVKGVSVMCCSTWVAKTVHKNLDKPLTCAKVQEHFVMILGIFQLVSQIFWHIRMWSSQCFIIWHSSPEGPKPVWNI
jgi:hypothetical protein